jgi:hypothetical protein
VHNVVALVTPLKQPTLDDVTEQLSSTKLDNNNNNNNIDDDDSDNDEDDDDTIVSRQLFQPSDVPPSIVISNASPIPSTPSTTTTTTTTDIHHPMRFASAAMSTPKHTSRAALEARALLMQQRFTPKATSSTASVSDISNNVTSNNANAALKQTPRAAVPVVAQKVIHKPLASLVAAETGANTSNVAVQTPLRSAMRSSALLSSRGAPTPIFDSIAGRVEQQLARRAHHPVPDVSLNDRGAQFWSPKQTAPPRIERSAAAAALDERYAAARADVAKQVRVMDDVRDASKAQLALEAVQDEMLRSRIDAHKRALAAASAGAKARARRVLTDDERVIIDAFIDADDDQVVAVVQDIEVHGRDAARLGDGGWLNDEIVNAYLTSLKQRAAKDERTYFKSHAFSSYFYEILSVKGGGYDYSRVRTWTRRFDLFALEKVCVPVHLGNHWCLAVINFAARRFEYYDSFGHDNEPCLSRLRRYLADEHQDKKKAPLADLDEWTDHVPKNIPHQTNGYDCGVFMLEFARHAMLRVDNPSADVQFPFAQRDMLDCRNRIALELIEADERRNK